MTKKKRQELVSIAQYLVDHASQIHYAQIRPMATRTIKDLAALKAIFAKGGTITMDCSESVTFLYRLAGLKDPNGLNYDGAGYTGTLLDHLKHYDPPSRGREGALLIFGAGTGTHVCMVMEPGDNPVLFSHGSEIGPLRLTLSNEATAHVGEPITMLDVSSL